MASDCPKPLDLGSDSSISIDSILTQDETNDILSMMVKANEQKIGRRLPSFCTSSQMGGRDQCQRPDSPLLSPLCSPGWGMSRAETWRQTDYGSPILNNTAASTELDVLSNNLKNKNVSTRDQQEAIYGDKADKGLSEFSDKGPESRDPVPNKIKVNDSGLVNGIDDANNEGGATVADGSNWHEAVAMTSNLDTSDLLSHTERKLERGGAAGEGVADFAKGTEDPTDTGPAGGDQSEPDINEDKADEELQDEVKQDPTSMAAIIRRVDEMLAYL